MTGQTLQKEQKLWYTDEQFEYAKKCSALEYEQSRGYELIRKGNYYQMKEHDSMVFRTDGRWFWNSRSLIGRAIQFISIDDAYAVCRYRDAWKFVLDTLDETLTLDYMIHVNEIVARGEALQVGALRNGSVTIGAGPT